MSISVVGHFGPEMIDEAEVTEDRPSDRCSLGLILASKRSQRWKTPLYRCSIFIVIICRPVIIHHGFRAGSGSIHPDMLPANQGSVVLVNYNWKCGINCD